MKNYLKKTFIFLNICFFVFSIGSFVSNYSDDVIGDDVSIFGASIYFLVISLIPLLYIEIWRKNNWKESKLDVLFGWVMLIVNVWFGFQLFKIINQIPSLPHWELRGDYYQLLLKISLVFSLINIALWKFSGFVLRFQKIVYLLLSAFLVYWFGSIVLGEYGSVPGGSEGVIVWSVLGLSLLNFLILLPVKYERKD